MPIRSSNKIKVDGNNNNISVNYPTSIKSWLIIIVAIIVAVVIVYFNRVQFNSKSKPNNTFDNSYPSLKTNKEYVDEIYGIPEYIERIDDYDLAMYIEDDTVLNIVYFDNMVKAFLITVRPSGEEKSITINTRSTSYKLGDFSFYEFNGSPLSVFGFVSNGDARKGYFENYYYGAGDYINYIISYLDYGIIYGEHPYHNNCKFDVFIKSEGYIDDEVNELNNDGIQVYEDRKENYPNSYGQYCDDKAYILLRNNIYNFSVPKLEYAGYRHKQSFDTSSNSLEGDMIQSNINKIDIGVKKEFIEDCFGVPAYRRNYDNYEMQAYFLTTCILQFVFNKDEELCAYFITTMNVKNKPIIIPESEVNKSFQLGSITYDDYNDFLKKRDGIRIEGHQSHSAVTRTESYFERYFFGDVGRLNTYYIASYGNDLFDYTEYFKRENTVESRIDKLHKKHENYKLKSQYPNTFGVVEWDEAYTSEQFEKCFNDSKLDYLCMEMLYANEIVRTISY